MTDLYKLVITKIIQQSRLYVPLIDLIRWILFFLNVWVFIFIDLILF